MDIINTTMTKKSSLFATIIMLAIAALAPVMALVQPMCIGALYELEMPND